MNRSLNNKQAAIAVFMLFAGLSITYLLLNIFDLTPMHQSEFQLVARFQNTNGIHKGTPIRIAGVKVGQVSRIELNTQTYAAKVTLSFSIPQLRIPTDSSISVYTDGLVGSKYLHINPGFSEKFLKDGERIAKTNPGVIIEELIAQAIRAFSLSPKDNS